VGKEPRVEEVAWLGTRAKREVEEVDGGNRIEGQDLRRTLGLAEMGKRRLGGLLQSRNVVDDVVNDRDDHQRMLKLMPKVTGLVMDETHRVASFSSHNAQVAGGRSIQP
jgi:hypothetical protein